MKQSCSSNMLLTSRNNMESKKTLVLEIFKGESVKITIDGHEMDIKYLKNNGSNRVKFGFFASERFQIVRSKAIHKIIHYDKDEVINESNI